MQRETTSGRMSELMVRLSDWVYRIIQGSEVLTLSRDFEWKISLNVLHKKTSASSHSREFKSMIRELVQHDHLPDYRVSLEAKPLIRVCAWREC